MRPHRVITQPYTHRIVAFFHACNCLLWNMQTPGWKVHVLLLTLRLSKALPSLVLWAAAALSFDENFCYLNGKVGDKRQTGDPAGYLSLLP